MKCAPRVKNSPPSSLRVEWSCKTTFKGGLQGVVCKLQKVHRIYCEEGLNLRSKRPRRHISAAHRMERPDLSSMDQC